MEPLINYIEESLTGSIKRIISRFRRNQETDSKKNFKNMEDIKLEYYRMVNHQSGVISQSEAVDLVHTRMKFPDGDHMFGSPVDNDYIRGFIQGVYDFGWMNFQNRLDTDPFGEKSCDAAYNWCMDKTNNRESALGLLHRYFYGWSFAKKLNITMSIHWMVDWGNDSPWRATNVRY